MFILGLLPCHNDATRRLEEQHLIFRLGTLQPKGINVDFTSFKISPPPTSSQDQTPPLVLASLTCPSFLPPIHSSHLTDQPL
eukprot:g40597.t1